jgi:hypothetical protein
MGCVGDDIDGDAVAAEFLSKLVRGRTGPGWIVFRLEIEERHGSRGPVLPLRRSVAGGELGAEHGRIESREPHPRIVPRGKEHHLQILDALGLGLRRIDRDGEPSSMFRVQHFLGCPQEHNGPYQLRKISRCRPGHEVSVGMTDDDRRPGVLGLDGCGDVSREVV